MRAILALIGIAAIAVVVLMALGMLKIQQEEGASLPSVSFNVEGGKMPSFKAETGTIGIGTTNKTVELPTVEMRNTTISLPTVEVKQAGDPSPTPTPAQ
ncbi:hypothetical protein [Sphingosinithalassobacter portus]|uniref:hypothetical protein n=1 Tax=Stakelama portus TaxID=2676234 RepID=UPI000D6E00C4|nr:hypothetical protein [Sphingosinithalassobacter portus]